MNIDKLIYSSGLCVLLYMTLVDCQVTKQPAVFYANLGQTISLPCSGQYACYSSYTFQNRVYEMVYLNNSLKYQVTTGTIGITNVKTTDAGFYACSNDCFKMKIDMISYYLQPMCKLSNNFFPS